MKAFLLTTFYLIVFAFAVKCQNVSLDSLQLLLARSSADSNRVRLLFQIADVYGFLNSDSILKYADSAAKLSRQLNFIKGEIGASNTAGESLRFLGDYPRALTMQMRALELSRKINDIDREAASLGFIGIIYIELKQYRQGLGYLFPALKLHRQVKNQLFETFTLTNIGNAYNFLGIADSALYYQQLSIKTYSGLKHGPLKSLILTGIGDAFFGLMKKDSALLYYHKALRNAALVNDKVNNNNIQNKIAELYKSINQYDSSLYYARMTFFQARQSGERQALLEASKLLAEFFRKKQNTDSALFYQDVAQAMSDSMYGPKKFKELQLLMLEDQRRQQEIQQDQVRYKNKTQMIALWLVVGVILIIAFILYRNNRLKQKANNVLENTLSELKSTQAQLIQSEKMASLGELTAGIAHEIQNPLNFVNNFSEVSKELFDEMKAALESGDKEEAEDIANNIIQNLEKINHHGKRADAIVKGMLQHSRKSEGLKEPTDINALCAEYLRLAYHGMKAKDKAFNAEIKTDFDESIGKINIVPQDIGKVLLNLFNNAFYAVNERLRSFDKLRMNLAQPDSQQLTANGYQPTIKVTARKLNDNIEIRVEDNGNGIPQNIIDKIFQPFFTTKPTGQGTGLGLSLAYDIVKAHGGEIKVKAKEGEGATFVIYLPIDSNI